jgi:hypothetical protein
MSIDIHLLSHNQTVTLSKEFIRKDLTGSLFSEALEFDPEAKEISITNPVVTPKVLLCLVNLSQGKEPIQHDPDLASSGHYLNLDVLLAYADPHYDNVGLPLIHSELELIVARDRASLLRYIIHRHPKHDYAPFLPIAFGWNARDATKVLLEIFPELRVKALDLAIKSYHYRMLQLVVSYTDINLLETECLLAVIRQGASNSLALLLKTLLERKQETELRALQFRIPNIHPKYQAYVARPDHSFLLEMYLQAIKEKQFTCLSVLIKTLPLNPEDEEVVQSVFKMKRLLYETWYRESH